MNNYRIPKLSNKNATCSSTDVSTASNSPRNLSLEAYLERQKNPDRSINVESEQLPGFVDKKIDDQNQTSVKEVDKKSINFVENKTSSNSTADEKNSTKSKTSKKSSSSSSSHKKSISDETKKSSSKHHSRSSKDEKKSNDSSSHKKKKSKRRRDSPENPDDSKKIISDDSTEIPPKKRRDSSPDKSSSKTKKSSSSFSSRVNRDSSSKNTVEDEKISTDDNRLSTQTGTPKKPRVSSRVLDDKKSSYDSSSREKPKIESSSSKKSSHKNDTSSSRSKNTTDEIKNDKKREREKSSGDYLQKMKRRYQREQEEIDKKRDENMNNTVRPKIPVKKKPIVENIVPDPIEDLSSIYEDVFVPDEISQQLDQQINLSRIIQFDSRPVVPVFLQPSSSSSSLGKEDCVNVPRSRDPRNKSNGYALVDKQIIDAVNVSQSLLAGGCLENSPEVIYGPGHVDEADDNEAGWSASSLYHGSISPAISGGHAAIPFECADGIEQQQMQQIPLHHQIQHQKIPVFHQIQLQHVQQYQQIQQRPLEYSEEFIIPTESSEILQSPLDPSDQTEFIIPEMIDTNEMIQEENSQSTGVAEINQTIRVRNFTDLVADFEKIKITEVPEILDNLNAVLPNECNENINLNDIFKDFSYVIQSLVHNERHCRDNIFESNGEIIGRKKKIILKYFELGLEKTEGNLDIFVELFSKYFKKNNELPYRLGESDILDLAKGVLDISVFF